MVTREFQHERFEELSALAALGQVSLEEFEELKTHLKSCATCRAGYADFAEILHEHLPMTERAAQSASASSSKISPAPGFRERFLEQARRQGIHFSDEIVGKSSKAPWQTRIESCIWRSKPLAAAFGLLALGIGFGLIAGRMLAKRQPGETAMTQAKEPQNQVAPLESRSLKSSSRSSDNGSGRGPTRSAELPSHSAQQATAKELNRLRREHDSVLDRSETLDAELRQKNIRLESLTAELNAAKMASEPKPQVEELEKKLAHTTAELQKLQQEKAVYSSTFADQQTQIRALMEQLSAQTETLERERSLSSAARDIRNLMGARSLHIIDVADVDSRGDEKPFGRVFYTEGKSLIFYAYDLDKRKKSLERYSFQAWGQKDARNGAAHSLGVFVADDQAQNRWVLKYDDPAVLNQIDAVFVTVEPVGGSERPRGRQLMYAFLKANPNHP